MRIPRVAGVGLALALAAVAPPAHADPGGVDEALRAYRDGALSDAMAAFERALAQGGNDRAALTTIYLHLGTLRAGARDPVGAVRAFEALLTLDPSATPPAGSSPLVTEPFARARERRGGAPALTANVHVPPYIQPGEPFDADVRVMGDTLPLVREARVVTGSWTGTDTDGAPLRLTIPGVLTRTSGPMRLLVSVHDEHGSALDVREVTTRVQAHEGDAPIRRSAPSASGVAHVAPADEPREGRSGSWLASPWFWGGAAVVVAGGVTAAVLLATSSDVATFSSVEVRR